MSKTHLSLIIPAYNEESIIKNTLDTVTTFLKTKKYKWEVIVVDDGSIDKTSTIVNNYPRQNIKLIKLPQNQGKGAALKKGFLLAKGQYIFYSDADLSVNIKNLDKFLDVLKYKSSIAIASRRIKGAKISVPQPWHREKMGQFYTFLTQIITGTRLADYTCGLKGFEKAAAKKIFKKARINRWAYDSEIMFLASKYNYSITQIPITWANRENTKVQLKAVILPSLKDLLSIRVSSALGKYN